MMLSLMFSTLLFSVLVLCSTAVGQGSVCTTGPAPKLVSTLDFFSKPSTLSALSSTGALAGKGNTTYATVLSSEYPEDLWATLDLLLVQAGQFQGSSSSNRRVLRPVSISFKDHHSSRRIQPETFGNDNFDM
mmetsp:Transcript_43182/g.92403  ORF Transcript_43182/g.92403 Transcript_43182/m.92403 type:complete len:132 (-) Transcript_43182:79-474(-)